MFLPPKLKTIGFYVLLSGLFCSQSVIAQQSDFTRRMEAMQQARLRVQQPSETVYVDSNEVGLESAPGSIGEMASAVSAPAQQSPRTLLGQSGRSSRSAIPARFNQAAGQYGTQNLRTAQLIDETIIDPGSPIVGSVMSPGGEIIDGGCTSCGEVGGYFDDQCCGRGGCAPGPCWITGFGNILRNGEYFAGATAFRSGLFSTPGVTTGQLSSDPSHGFYEGFNFGVPLCRLTCGLLSGQFGLRATQTNFRGAEFTPQDRNQIFLTAGLYRRVDYGIQGGLVIDYLSEEWFTETLEVSQIRGDLAWVYPSGSTMGFRFATNVEMGTSNGVFAGNAFTNALTSTESNYRFYYRCEKQEGGFCDGYLGWTDSQQTVLGLDFDMPVRERAALQAGFTYYLNDDGVPANSGFEGGNIGEAYNFYLGFVLRPRGRSHYRSYDRPLFTVADNGTMLLKR